MLCVERSVPPHKETVTRIAGMLWRSSGSTVSLLVLDAKDDAKLPLELCPGMEDPTSHPLMSEEDALLLSFFLLASAENESISHLSRDEVLAHARSIADSHELLRVRKISGCREAPSYLSIVLNAIEECTGHSFDLFEKVSDKGIGDDLLFYANLNGIL